VQPDGKVLIGGYARAIARIEEEGTPLYSFRAFLLRVHADGGRDAGFPIALGNEGFEWSSDFFLATTGTALAVQPDGKVLFAGAYQTINGTNRTGIARFHANGSLDLSFNPGLNFGAPRSLALQSDGKVLAGGYSIGGPPHYASIVRLHSDGSLDGSYQVIGLNSPLSTIVLQPDGKVLIGGSFTAVNGTARNRMARLNADGSLDSTCNPGAGANGVVRAIALQPDGNILIGGDFTTVNGAVRPHVARLLGDPPPELSIAWVGSSVRLSWPVIALNFQLQESTDLSSPNGWSPVPQPAVTDGAHLSVTVPALADRKFFRLKSR
jgi:uncharacterized delta-60 repeat protein